MTTKQTFAEDMAALFGEFLEGEDEKGCVREDMEDVGVAEAARYFRRGDISRDLLDRLLKQAGISKKEWRNL
jgi:hypothetical protein